MYTALFDSSAAMTTHYRALQSNLILLSRGEWRGKELA